MSLILILAHFHIISIRFLGFLSSLHEMKPITSIYWVAKDHEAHELFIAGIHDKVCCPFGDVNIGWPNNPTWSNNWIHSDKRINKHKKMFEDDPCLIKKSIESLHQVTVLELKPWPSLCFHQYLDGFDWEGLTWGTGRLGTKQWHRRRAKGHQNFKVDTSTPVKSPFALPPSVLFWSCK